MSRHYSATAQPTTLSSSVNDSTTAIPVTATTGFPAVPYTLALDYGSGSQEVVLVTNVAGLNLTVERGYDNTAAVSHSTGAVVQHVHSAIDFTEVAEHVGADSDVHGVSGDLVGATSAQTLTNKDLSSGTNTFPGSLATDTEVTAALSTAQGYVTTHAANTATHGATGAVVGTTNTQTLTNKTVNLSSNTLTGTTAQFNTALSDGDFATLAGTETLSNKTLSSPKLSGSLRSASGDAGLEIFSEPGADKWLAIVGSDSGSDWVEVGIVGASTGADLRLVPGAGGDVTTGGNRVLTTGDLTLGAWTSYTPTWTGTGTNPTLGSHTITAAYVQFGKKVTGYIHIVFGAADYGSGTYEFGLPVTAKGGFNTAAMVVAQLYDSSGPARASRTGYVQTSTSVRLQSEGGTQVTNTSPWTWANNDVLVINFTYEAA